MTRRDHVLPVSLRASVINLREHQTDIIQQCDELNRDLLDDEQQVIRAGNLARSVAAQNTLDQIDRILEETT